MKRNYIISFIIVGIVSLFFISCQRNFYPSLSEGSKNIGFATSKNNIQKFTSASDNGFVMLSVGKKRVYGGRTIGLYIELSGYSAKADFDFSPQRNISAKVILSNGKELECGVLSAKEKITFPAGDKHTLGVGLVYITSPKKFSKVDYLKINFNIAGVTHTLSLTPKEELQSHNIAQIELPDYSGKPKSIKQQTAPVKLELTQEQLQVRKSIESANKVTNEIKTNIQADFDSTMYKMRKSQAIADNIDTRVKAEMLEDLSDEGKVEYNLRVKYEYEVNNDISAEKKLSYDNVGDDFGPGKYKLSSSNAARVTLSMLKKTIQNELKPYLTRGRKVTIKITGSADGSPIRGSIPYGGEFGEINETPCFINGIIDYLTINTKKGITSNEELAFLRTFAVKDFIEKNIEDLRVTDNQYQHFAEVSEEKGADKRKISMEIIIHEAFGDKYPELSTQTQKPIAERISEVDTGIVKTAMHNPDAVAVVIGNSKYEFEKDVLFAGNDAKTVKEYLIKTLGYSEDMIFYFENATSADFRNVFGTAEDFHGDLANKVRKNISDVFVYYSGHGVPDWDTQEPYMLPVDVQGGDSRKLKRNAYKLSLLYDNLEKLDAKTVTVVLDACYSGNRIERSTSALMQIKAKEPVVKEPENMIVLTAAQQGEEASWYKEKNHGMFTYCFLMGIKYNTTPAFNNNNELSYKELYNYLADENYGVPYYSRNSGNTEHHPTILGKAQQKTFVIY